MVFAPTCVVTLFTACPAQGAVSNEPLHCAAVQSAQQYALPHDDGELDLGFSGSDPAWVEIVESGQSITSNVRRHIDASTAGPLDSDVLTISQPTRLGQHWIFIQPGDEIRIKRQLQTRAQGSFGLTLHCEDSTEFRAKLDWLRQASKLSMQLNKPVDKGELPTLLQAVGALDKNPLDPSAHAVALHFRADALAANNQSKEAVSAYAKAEQAWAAINDRDRAAAAHLGYVEELYLTGNHQMVLDVVSTSGQPRGDATFFSARLSNARCLSLQALGRQADAGNCYEMVLSQYKKLGERSEYVVVLQSYASLQREVGELGKAETLGLEGLRNAIGPDAPLIRGRLQLMLADIVLQSGRPAAALEHAERAVEEFASAQWGAQRWRANAMLFIAKLYSQMGAKDEAYSWLAEAVKILAQLDAPSRIAISMEVFADMEAESQNFDQAIFWRRAAEQIYESLHMATAAESTRAARLELQSHLNDFATVEKALQEHGRTHSLDTPQWKLLGAELALNQRRLSDASTMLAELHSAPLSLPDQVRLAQLESKYWNIGHDPASADQALLNTAAHIKRLAREAGNPLLAYAIDRQVIPLMRSAFRLILEQDPGIDTGRQERVWNWLVLAKAVYQSSPTASTEPEKFDRAVAEELLTSTIFTKTSAERAARRELLSILAQPPEKALESYSAFSPISLASIQKDLAEDTAYVAFVDGGSRGALLWVTHDEAILLDTATPDDLRTSGASLRGALKSPLSSLGEIRTAAQVLSTQLLGGVAGKATPKRLLVQSDELLEGVALSVLTWPGQQQPLIETTTIEEVQLARVGADRYANVTPSVHVVVASQQQAESVQLPNLATASLEPQLIRSVTSEHALTTTDDSKATREAVLSALDEPGAWVHIAAHGTAQPQRIGYAGLWLEPSGEDKTPAFLSWLDILDRGVRADLVVLNACQLGDSGNAINGNLSFAAAVSRAGARQVVAALWPVSDSAAALWVPTFYSALVADPEHNAAAALRAAQLRLRASRAFTHPFFWAGMQATSRLSLPGPPSSSASIATKSHGTKLH